MRYLILIVLLSSPVAVVIGGRASTAPDALKTDEDIKRMRIQASNWLQSSYDSIHGWGDDTHRAVIAISLATNNLTHKPDNLYSKQLEINLAVDIARNGSKQMKTTDLALYINALMAVCENPRNFHGYDLVQTLRNQLEREYRTNHSYSPLAVLTLCINKKSDVNDGRKLSEITRQDPMLDKMGIYSIALMAAECLSNLKGQFHPAHTVLKDRIITKLKQNGIPGNIYEAALLFQALNTIQEASNYTKAALEFILNAQQENGGFGDILATYYVMPILSNRAINSLIENCSYFSTKEEPIPLEVLKYYIKEKVLIKYYLIFKKVKLSMQIQVPRNSSILDIMRLAEDKNPSFSFRLDKKRSEVYSIAGIPNDAEKGKYWSIFFRKSKASREASRISTNEAATYIHRGSVHDILPYYFDEILMLY